MLPLIFSAFTRRNPAHTPSDRALEPLEPRRLLSTTLAYQSTYQNPSQSLPPGVTGTWSSSSGGGTLPSHGIKMNTAGSQPHLVVSDSFSLSLSGLPAHSMVFVNAGIELYRGGDVGTSTTLEYGGTTQTFTTEAPDDISFSGPSGWVAASGTSMTITVTAHDYPDGYMTDLQDVSVYVYNPTVSVGGGGTVSEDSDAPLTFTVSRDLPLGYLGTSDGDEAIPDTTVSLTAGGTATAGTDYSPALPSSATLTDSNSNAKSFTVTPILDVDDTEGSESISLTAMSSQQYDLGAVSANGTIEDAKLSIQAPASANVQSGQTKQIFATVLANGTAIKGKKIKVSSGSQLTLTAEVTSEGMNGDWLITLTSTGNNWDKEVVDVTVSLEDNPSVTTVVKVTVSGKH